MTPASPSLASEAAALIGIPWARGAQGPDAYDCWAAAGMVQRELFGRDLPALTEAAHPYYIAKVRRQWRVAARPRDGDLVEMRRGGQLNHVGVWVAGGVLHCQRGAGMCFDPRARLELLGWRTRFWTPAPRPKAARAPHPSARAVYAAGLDPVLDPGQGADALIAAHRAMPLDLRDGDTVAAVLARAGLDPEGVVCFLRRPATAVEALPDASDADGLAGMLDALGAVPQADWAARPIRAGEVLLVQDRPQGGGGSNPIRTLLSIAVTAAAAFVAGPVAAGGLGLGAQLGGTLGIGAVAGGRLVFGALSLVGRFLVNALIPPPSPPGIDRLSDDVSPTFSARAQVSVARPGAPMPVQFGRHIHQLDAVAPPWATFDENTQILHQLLALGIGEHDLEEVRLGDVTVWANGALTGNLPGVSIEHVTAGQPITLFDEAVWTQSDVSGLALDPDAVVGWHNAVPPGRMAIAVEVDIAFRQLVRIDSNGNSQQTSVDIRVEAQQIDNQAAPLGDPFELETLTFTAASRDAVRSSHRWFVPDGRYRVRMTRLTPAGGTNTFDDAVWAGLKGVLPGGRTYQGLELLAVRVEVGEAFAAQRARDVKVVKTRKLPVWDGAAWTAPQPTREIAWAAAEIARMHGRLADLDFDELLALHATWQSRGDRFDSVIDQSMSFWEALQAALRAGRAQPDQLGRRLRIWRDEPQPVPRQLFSERNIRRGSLSIQPILKVSERPERLVAQYMDETTWEITELAVGPVSGREKRERFFGITDRAQVAREVSHDVRASRARSVRVSFEAELETRLLLRGDPIAVAHRDVAPGESVGLEYWEFDVIGLSRPVDWSAMTDPGMYLSTPTGGVWGPLSVSAPDGAAQSDRAIADLGDLAAVIDQTGVDPRDWIARSDARDEAIRAVIGSGTEQVMRLLVETIGEERDGFAPVTALDDDPAAHDAPVDQTGALDGAIAGLDAALVSGQVEIEIAVAVEFQNAGLGFVHEYSDDDTVTWLPLIEDPATTLSVTAPTGMTHLRTAAVQSTKGPWVVAPLAGTSLPAPANLIETTPGLYASQAMLDVAADAVDGASSYRWTLRDGGGALLGVIIRVSPQLSLTLAELDDLGAVLRTLEVSIQASGPSGTGAASALTLANPAPAAPTGLVKGTNNLTWDPAPEADVIGWRVEWDTTLLSPVEVTDPVATWADTVSGVATVRARDAAGLGPGTAIGHTAIVETGGR